jgi:hypothetical protein
MKHEKKEKTDKDNLRVRYVWSDAGIVKEIYRTTELGPKRKKRIERL